MRDKNLMDGIRKAHELLMSCPDAMDVALVKTDAGHLYQFVNPSKEAQKIRKEVRIILWQTWQSGAYNYAELAGSLRVDEAAIKAALEEEWRMEVGLV